jgi:hypothetical protein
MELTINKITLQFDSNRKYKNAEVCCHLRLVHQRGVISHREELRCESEVHVAA